jgi:cytochrome c oxidase, cbb3-type, subunit III
LPCSFSCAARHGKPCSATRRVSPIATTGHVWDGDLQEFNNPLPRWWMGLFILTLIFAVIYLSLYGGLAFYKGILGYSSDKMYQQESAAFDARIEPLYAAYMKTPIPELAANPTAMATGQRMFLTYCSQCHGSDAGGTKGFPNLTIHNANAWLYGNSPEVLVETIANGRLGMMPPMEAAIGGKPGVLAVANYVRSLSGMKHDAQLAAQGKPLFATACAACHAADGTGSKALGAPDLADPKRQWLFGSSIEPFPHHREGSCRPDAAQKDFLSPEKIHLLAAYVYSISHGAEAAK